MLSMVGLKSAVAPEEEEQAAVRALTVVTRRVSTRSFFGPGRAVRA